MKDEASGKDLSGWYQDEKKKTGIIWNRQRMEFIMELCVQAGFPLGKGLVFPESRS